MIHRIRQFYQWINCMDFAKFCQILEVPFNDRIATCKYIKVKDSFAHCICEEPLLMETLWKHYESGERNKV